MLSYPSVEPFFAPLSKPMITQALAFQEEEHTPSISLDIHAMISHFTAKYSLLRERIAAPRQETYQQMLPAVKNGEFTTNWMLSSISKYTPKKHPQNSKTISAVALSRWRESGLVHYQNKNTPDFDSGAALITLRRLIPHRERGWLPTPPKSVSKNHYFTKEPLWWCWRQDSPACPIVPCPVPLPEDVPTSALLWTDWLGASWKPEWLCIGNLGCCRWARTTIRNDRLLWATTEEDLEIWGTPISETYKKALRNDVPLTLHTLATSALLLLATERLEDARAFSFDSLRLVV